MSQGLFLLQPWEQGEVGVDVCHFWVPSIQIPLLFGGNSETGGEAAPITSVARVGVRADAPFPSALLSWEGVAKAQLVAALEWQEALG